MYRKVPEHAVYSTSKYHKRTEEKTKANDDKLAALFMQLPWPQASQDFLENLPFFPISIQNVMRKIKAYKRKRTY